MFDNREMKQPRKGKPHIQLIEGYWRVSPMKRRYPSVLWAHAHGFATAQNELRIKGM